MKRSTSFKWYKIVGRPSDGNQSVFVYFVEASSPHHVLKYHGGKRKCVGQTGVVIVQFPNTERDVYQMPKSWDVRSANEAYIGDTSIIVKMVPATRYLCECGQERFSEYPYASMWCSCGKKAWPNPLNEVLSI